MRWERAALILALAGGALLRLPQLDLRPMHTDEAVHAIKFGALLENGTYRYDRHEYHGPTLNYFTLIPAWLTGRKTLSEVTETTLRIVPVFFGLCLILLVFHLPGIDRTAASLAAILSASSPAMVFYSRYYIQETLLVCFAFGLIASASRPGPGGRAVMAGVCAGLMCATKETWLISAGAMGIAFLGVRIIRQSDLRPAPPVRARSTVIALISAGIVWVLFFSSFFTNWDGVRDSLLAYETYFARAGENVRHGHPWYYFLEMLAGTQGDHGPLWSEAGILLFAAAGLWIAFKERPGSGEGKRDIRLFLGLYALIMLVVSSALPYKTPWLVLGALQPLIIMAGIGISALLNRLGERGLRIPGILIAVLLVSHLAWQAWMGSFRYYDDPVNPYVYSHPGDDVRQIASAVTRAVHGGGRAVQVICSGGEYWPLPWYLRALPDVGWWSEPGEAFVPTSVILVSPELEPALLTRMYETRPPGERELYVPLFDRPMFLRPGKELRGYITLGLRNALLKGKGE